MLRSRWNSARCRSVDARFLSHSAIQAGTEKRLLSAARYRTCASISKRTRISHHVGQQLHLRNHGRLYRARARTNTYSRVPIPQMNNNRVEKNIKTDWPRSNKGILYATYSYQNYGPHASVLVFERIGECNLLYSHSLCSAPSSSQISIRPLLSLYVF